MSGALVGPLPTITFYGAGEEYVTQAYEVPRNTCDLRARLCTDHHPACDCREALLNENLHEHIYEWKLLRDVARNALQGHQLRHPLGTNGYRARQTDSLCLCSGCVIARANLTLVGSGAVDLRTGRVQ